MELTCCQQGKCCFTASCTFHEQGSFASQSNKPHSSGPAEFIQVELCGVPCQLKDHNSSGVLCQVCHARPVPEHCAPMQTAFLGHPGQFQGLLVAS